MSRARVACVFAFLAAAAAGQASADAEAFLAAVGVDADDADALAAAYARLAFGSEDRDVSLLAFLRLRDAVFDATPDPSLAERARAVRDDVAAPGFRRAFAAALRREALARAGRFDDLEREAGMDGVIRAWRATGPFGFAAEHYGGLAFGPERAVADDATYPGTLGPVGFAPCVIPAADEIVDPSRALAPAAGCLYAVAALSCTSDVVVEARLDAFGSAELFADGRRALVLDRALARAPYGRGVVLRLAAGPHRLMVKLLTPRNTAFRLSLRTPDGAPVDLSDGASGPVRLVRDGVGPEPTTRATGEGPDGAFRPRDLRDAWGAAPTSRALTLVRALLLAASGLPDEAAELAAPVGAATDLTAGECVVLRELAFEDDETPEADRKARARDFARRLEAASPGHFLAVAAAADEEAENDRGEKGLEILEAALAKRPENVALRRGVARVASRLGFTADAERATLAVLNLRPASVVARRAAADLARARGDAAGALAEDERLLELDASDGAARFSAATARLRTGRFDAAEAHLRVLLRLDPRNLAAALALADVRREAGDAAGEIAELERLAKAFPHDAEAPRRLLERALSAGRTDAARAAAEDVLRRAPDDADGVRATLDRLRPPPPDATEPYLVDAAAYLKTCPGPEAYPDASVVLLLDQVLLRVRADGTATQETHQLHRLQDARGRDELGAVTTEGEVLSVRTLAPDGRTWWPNSLRPGEYEIAGLAPGRVVERRYRKEFGRFVGRPEDFGGFYFQDVRFAAPFHLTRFVAVIPKALGLEPLIERFPKTPVRREVGDDVVWIFELERMPRLKTERAAPPGDELAPYVAFRRGGSFAELNRRTLAWFEGDALPTPTLRRAAAEATAGVSDPLAKARRIYAAVCERVPSEDGAGPATTTWIERSGPRLPLFAALLAAADVPWRPALLRMQERFGPPPRVGLLDDDAFRAPAVRIDVPGAPPTYVLFDLRRRPFGALPYVLTDAPVFVAGRDGGFLDRTPAAPLDKATGFERTFDLVLGADGTARGTATVAFGPDHAAQLREQLASADRSQLDPVLLRLLMEPLGRFAARATGPVLLTGAEDAAAPLIVSAPVELRRLLKDAASGGELACPIAPRRLARGFVDRTERTHPVVFRDVDVARDVATIRLDPAWLVADLPGSFVVRGPLGSFSLTRSVDDAGTVRFERRTQFEPFTLPASEFGAFAAWLAAIDAEEERTIPLRRQGP